jgi:carbonic anhydrase
MTQPSPSALPDDLLVGYRRFQRGLSAPERDLYARLAAEGQRPHAMVIACSDSRSAPEAVFDAGPGELFVVRNVAALVPVYAPDAGRHAASAALEFAVLALGVESILVMGHGGCGGVKAAFDDAAPLTATDFIGAWVDGLRDLEPLLDPADAADAQARPRALEHLVVEQSLANLRTFPWVRRREATGSLTIHGLWFDVGLRELHVYTPGGWAVQPQD